MSEDANENASVPATPQPELAASNGSWRDLLEIQGLFQGLSRSRPYALSIAFATCGVLALLLINLTCICSVGFRRTTPDISEIVETFRRDDVLATAPADAKVPANPIRLDSYLRASGESGLYSVVVRAKESTFDNTLHLYVTIREYEHKRDVVILAAFLVEAHQQPAFGGIWKQFERRIRCYIPEKSVSINDAVAQFSSGQLADSFREVDWFRLGNAGTSGVILRIRPEWPSVATLSRDVALTTVAAWSKSHLHELLKVRLPDDLKAVLPTPTEVSRNGGETLEAELEARWGREWNRLPIIVTRVLSGSIQLVTLTVALLTIIINLSRRLYISGPTLACSNLALAGKWTSFELTEDASDEECAEAEADREKARERSAEAVGNKAVQIREGGSWVELDDASLSVLIGIREIPQNFNLRNEREQFNAWYQHYEQRLEAGIANRKANRRLVSWLVGSITAWGFFGTIIGISATVGGISGVLSEEFGKQKSELAALTQDLSVAFDTTLVGIICFIVAGLLSAKCEQLEEVSLRQLFENVASLRAPFRSTR